jgi:hypothetical protein
MARLSLVEARDITRGLALIELVEARALATALPGPVTFEQHADIAFRIGACGRRIEALLSSRFYSEHGNWRADRPTSESFGDITINPVGLYHSLLAYIGEDLHLYDFIWSLKQCLAGTADDGLQERVDASSSITYLKHSGRLPTPTTSDIRRMRRGPRQKVHDQRWRFGTPNQPLTRMLRVEQTRGLLQKLHYCFL